MGYNVIFVLNFNFGVLPLRERLSEAIWVQWQQERAGLRSLPERPHLCFIPRWLTVSNRNRYSVPSAYVGKTVLVRAYAEKIEVVDREQVIATHRRSHGRQQTLLELEHYLSVMERKPHSVTHAAVVRRMTEVYQQIRRRMSNNRPDGYKDFLQILLLHRVFPAQDILRAIEEKGLTL